MKTKAAVAWKAGSPLTIETVDLQGPKFGEVLVEIKATGICHTDYYTLSGADPEGIFPAVLGHEAAVEEGEAELAGLAALLLLFAAWLTVANTVRERALEPALGLESHAPSAQNMHSLYHRFCPIVERYAYATRFRPLMMALVK